MKNLINKFHRKSFMCMLALAAIFFVGCEKQFEFDLPESGSKIDSEFPTANFSYASTSDDFRTIQFTNLSFEATTFAWDFGNGDTSIEEDPIFSFPAEGTYPVTLVASDGNGVTGEVTIDVEVVQGPFQPIIQEAGFEDNTLPDGSGDGRDSWRNNDIGGVIQITGSPVTFGDQGAKLPASQDRIGYQEITVEPESNYDLTFWYTMLAGSTDPFVTVSILGVTTAGGTITSREDAAAATIASVTVNDDTDPAAYLEQQLSFNSGENETVAIYFFNGPVEARLDNFTIDIGLPGAVPPSAGFDIQQSETNFLEYTFTNASTGGASYLWDFGDGNTSTEESPTHVYASPDAYDVTLTVTGATNLTGTLTRGINILAPVTADFDFAADPADYRTINFTDASEGAVMLLWEFGDGFQFTGMNPSHTYAEDGIYTVTLTAYSITENSSQTTEMIVIAEGFVVQVLNGTFDEYTNNTGDNADAWDMTPNSTVVDNNGNEIDSPYRPLWFNEDLNAYIDATYCTSEQPGSTSDGNNGTRGGKFSNPCRRLYQVVQVEQGAEYTFSIDTRSEAMGVNTEVFLLNEEITTEEGINASTSDPAIDAYMEITNDFDNFATNTMTFTASSNKIVIYVRALGAIDSENEVFLDNVIIE